MKDFTIKVVPFTWNDNFSEVALEDFSMIQGSLSYGTCQSIGMALAKLQLLEEQGRLIEVIRCRNCIRHENSSSTEGFGWCDVYECITADDGYCSRAVDKLAGLKECAE